MSSISISISSSFSCTQVNVKAMNSRDTIPSVPTLNAVPNSWCRANRNVGFMAWKNSPTSATMKIENTATDSHAITEKFLF